MAAPLPPLLVHFSQGLLMGTSDIIPGVSGGTMALIVGIYERLIASVRAGLTLPVTLFRGWEATRRQFSEVEWRLVLPLAAGIVTAIVIASKFIPYLLETYPAECRGLFFGLIAASLLIPWRRIGTAGARELALMAAMAVLAFVLTGLPENEAHDPGLLRVFLSASIAICAMILPGISGAFLLLVLGMYEVTLEALNALDLAYIGVFVLGAAVGLGLFSRLLHYLLDRHHDLTMAALLGLMAGSLRALWPWLSDDRELLYPTVEPASLVVLGLALLGFALVLGLTWIADRKMNVDLA